MAARRNPVVVARTLCRHRCKKLHRCPQPAARRLHPGHAAARGARIDMADRRRFAHAGSGANTRSRSNRVTSIVAGAVSATQQNLAEGRQDLYHAFGGNRRGRGSSHPFVSRSRSGTGRDAGFLQCTGGNVTAIACRSRPADLESGRKAAGAARLSPHPCPGDQNADRQRFPFI